MQDKRRVAPSANFERRTSNRGKAVIALCIVLSIGALAPEPAKSAPSDKPQLPNPMGYVSDYANMIEPDWKARIRSVCQDLERKTGVEMVVVTVPSTKPYKRAQDYAAALYERWGIGSAQQEHGLLLLAVVDPSTGSGRATVTLGKSMLPVITPPVVEEVGRKYLDPAFRNARFGEGLYRATVALASASQNVRVGEKPRSHLKGLAVFLTLGTSFGALWFLWWISRPDLRHPYGRLRRGEFWGSGQGGFGGNFGGFGGGMSGEGLR